MSKSTTTNNTPTNPTPFTDKASTRKIRILPEEIISKISAGEVVERPASVLKELIENSLDAGSGRIIAEIEGGGKKLIRVTDDGEGIPPSEIALALERHATSKINTYEDLFRLGSMGFRGEALAAIGAVSEIKIESSGAGAGMMFGKMGGVFPSVVKNGTSVEVTNLFFNTPARMKFLKSDSAEKSAMLQVIQSHALANHKVAFEIFYDKKNILRLDVAGTLEKRIADVLKEDVFLKTIPFTFSDLRNGLSVTARISAIDSFISSKTLQYLFVNKRPVYSRTVTRAVYDGLKGVIPSGKHPIFIIYITIPPDKVDVNISPTKKEVKFSDDNNVYSAIFLNIKKLLASQSPLNYTLTADKQKHSAKDGASYLKDMPSADYEEIIAPRAQNISYNIGGNNSHMRWMDEQIELKIRGKERESGELISADELRKSRIKFIGEVFGYCLLASDEENLYIIDSHAASERVLYEKYKNSAEPASSQLLLSPVIINLPPFEFERARMHLNKLNKLGWRLEIFGGNSLKCEGTPSCLGEVNPHDILDAVFRKSTDTSNDEEYTADDNGKKQEDGIFSDEYIIKKSCHAAVRGREKLSFVEAQRLVNEFFSTPSYQTCPHGRPTVIKLSREEVSRKFRRE